MKVNPAGGVFANPACGFIIRGLPWLLPPGLLSPGLLPGLLIPGLLIPGLLVPELLGPGLLPPGLLPSGLLPPGLLIPELLGPGLFCPPRNRTWLASGTWEFPNSRLGSEKHCLIYLKLSTIKIIVF